MSSGVSLLERMPSHKQEGLLGKESKSDTDRRKLMPLPTDMCAALLSCSRLVKLLLSPAPLEGKVPFINVEWWREDD